MRFYEGQHGFYAGVDLHARTLHVCVLDANGKVALDVNIPASPDAFLRAIAPYRHDLVVGCECLFAWYWLAHLCASENASGKQVSDCVRRQGQGHGFRRFDEARGPRGGGS
jgi:hypothetical protein